MPRDSWENAALLDTGETGHVALLLSPDGGSSRMQLYIGEKGKAIDGSPSQDFLARNGLAFGSYYFLNDTLPSSGTSTDGFFDTTTAGALTASKLEDIDTNPSDGTRAVLGNQNFGVFTFDFALDFSSPAGFDAAASSFAITKIHDDTSGTLGSIGDADNVDWTAPTLLGGTTYADGLIFVNEDNSNGEIWLTTPDGAQLTNIANTAGNSAATETSGILDLSALLGYRPGSIVLTSNQGSQASLSVLIHPAAELVGGDFDFDGDVDGADFLAWQRNPRLGDLADWQLHYGTQPSPATTAVPEPATASLLVGLMTCALELTRRRKTSC